MTDELFHRIDEEFANSSSSGFAEIAGDEPVHLFVNGADTTAIMEGPYNDNPESAFPSEFDQLLDQRAQAENASPTNDLDAHTRLQDAQREAANAVAPFSCVNPASIDRGNLGQTVLLKPGTSPTASVFLDGGSQMVAFWPGDDREACPVTVTAAPVLPYTSDIVRAVAQIKWGAHGAKYEALVDVGTGVEFTINASNVYLSVYLEGGDFTGSSTSADMQAQLVAGSIGFYSTDRKQAVVRSLRSTPSASDITFLRPAFATSLLSFERNDLSGPTTLKFLDQHGTTVFTRQYAANTYIDAPISMPSEIAAVKVTNGGGGAPAYTLIFGLF